jgi:nicotinamidase-related amidase
MSRGRVVTASAFDPSDAALVTLDLQQGVVSTYATDPAFIARAAAVVEAARRARMPVIHVRVAFRPGVPEASPRNAFLSAVKGSPPHQRFFSDASGAFHPGLRVESEDLMVTKSRVSAFAGTDLELLLRAADRHTLVLLGIATSGAVLATALQAADLDYRPFVIGDCCADAPVSVHEQLIANVLPRQATVLTSDEMIAALRQP